MKTFKTIALIALGAMIVVPSVNALIDIAGTDIDTTITYQDILDNDFEIDQPILTTKVCTKTDTGFTIESELKTIELVGEDYKIASSSQEITILKEEYENCRNRGTSLDDCHIHMDAVIADQKDYVKKQEIQKLEAIKKAKDIEDSDYWSEFDPTKLEDTAGKVTKLIIK